MILESLELPVFWDFDSMAQSMGITKKLLYFLSNDEEEKRYKTYYLEKHNGKKREINAPCLSLKLIQRWILENILYNVRVSGYSYGFAKGGNQSPIAEVANKHKNNLYVLKLDLESFYPSIKRKLVYKQFLAIGYNDKVANLLTNICTFHGKLPQGAVTSPYLANLICYRLDMRIAGYCNKHDIAYTRYADDLVFSSDNRSILKKSYGILKEIIEDEEFALNLEKTRFLTPKIQKNILGININDGLKKVPKELKKKVRSMIHYQIISGDYSQNDVIRGYIAYIDSVENGYKNKTVKYVEGFYNDYITLIPELVESYNRNKLYKNMGDMEIKRKWEFPETKDDMFLIALEEERRQYLIKKGIAEDKIIGEYL